MNYYVDFDNGQGRVTRAFDYDISGKVLVPRDYRVDFEQGSDYWAVKIAGDYALVMDGDGLSVGDFSNGTREVYPKLNFTQYANGISTQIASLTADGYLSVTSVQEVNFLPTGMNLLDEVCFNRDGVFTTKIGEIWFLTKDGNYLTLNGQLIKVCH